MSDTLEVEAFKEAALKCNEKKIKILSLMLELDSMSDEEREAAYDEFEKLSGEFDGLEIEREKKSSAVEAQGDSDI